MGGAVADGETDGAVDVVDATAGALDATAMASSVASEAASFARESEAASFARESEAASFARADAADATVSTSAVDVNHEEADDGDFEVQEAMDDATSAMDEAEKMVQGFRAV